MLLGNPARTLLTQFLRLPRGPQKTTRIIVAMLARWLAGETTAAGVPSRSTTDGFFGKGAGGYTVEDTAAITTLRKANRIRSLRRRSG